MQEQTPKPKKLSKNRGHKKSVKKPSRPVRGTKLAGNNPYQNMPVKSNNLPGFTFGGSVY